jgi:hypothetical protein
MAKLTYYQYMQSMYDWQKQYAECALREANGLGYDDRVDILTQLQSELTMAKVKAGWRDLRSTYDLDGRTLITPEITLNHNEHEIHLGSFTVALQNRFPDFHSILVITGGIPVGRSNITHPHISGISLCLGHGAFPHACAMLRSDFVSAHDIVLAVLGSYSDYNPCFHLERWIDKTCPLCDDTVKDLITCGDCRTQCCRGCLDNSRCPSCSSDYWWYN